MQQSTIASFAENEVQAAYQYFGIDPREADFVSNDEIILAYHSHAKTSLRAAESRRYLRILGNARNSSDIKNVANDDGTMPSNSPFRLLFIPVHFNANSN